MSKHHRVWHVKCNEYNKDYNETDNNEKLDI